jgi:putative GTP pyrophosphokinase
MTSSEKPGTTKATVESVLADFDSAEDTLAAFCARTKVLIDASLQDANIRYHSVQSRVKSRQKLREKYSDPEKDYKRLEDITDLAGLRIITYYEDDIDRVADVIKREFELDQENSVDKRETEPDRFAYSAVNYVCKHLKKRATDVEYKKFADIRCEIQITSILRHAWSEIEHEWYDLKDAYPKNIKRRFYRLAALLEIAESEFLDLRKGKTEYEQSVKVRVEANVPELPIDAVSIKSFVEQERMVAELDELVAVTLGRSLATGFSDSLAESRARAAKLAGMKNLQDVRDLLRKYGPGVPEFVRRCREEFWPEHQTASKVSRGVSIFQLSRLVASIHFHDSARAFEEGLPSTTTWDLARQVKIAAEIVAKYPR